MKRSDLRRMIKEELLTLINEADERNRYLVDIANSVWREAQDLEFLMRPGMVPFPEYVSDENRRQVIELLMAYKAQNANRVPNMVNIDALGRTDRALYNTLIDLLTK